MACAILSFLLISIDHAHEHLGAVRRGLSVLVYPLQAAASLPVRLIDVLADTFATRSRLQIDNVRLLAENRELRARSLRFDALMRENERLRLLLESSANRGEEVAVADILEIDRNPVSRQIVIDKGSRQHIYVGQPIADAHGILGQIVEVTPFTSTALLIADARHAMAVQVNRTGLRAIAVGAGDADQLFLNFVPTNADVQVGDLVISSGLDNRFPAGYPVGEVSEVSTSPGEQFAKVAVKPSAEISRVREVLLVWPQRRSEPPTESP